MKNKSDIGFLTALLAVSVFIVGMAVGWLTAHKEVSTECIRQGSF